MAERRWKFTAGLAMLGTAAWLAGCSQAPAYHPPVTPAPAAFREAGPWVPAAPASAGEGGHWWEAFGDRELDDLEGRIETSNPNLAVALGRRDEAMAYLGQARAELFPSIGVGSSLSWNRQSDNRPLRGSNQPDEYGANTLGGGVGYELDLWGRVRNSVAAGRADAVASVDDVAAVRLSLEAELASDYLTLRGLDEEAALLSGTADAYAKADEMTRNRFLGGVADGIDVGRSGAQLADAQAQLADVRNARAKIEHAIASLVGTPASVFSLAPSPTMPKAAALPLGVPSTLLQRRPDVAAAERRMYAANRRIGVARAAFFPAIGLGGAGGTQATAIAGLISAPNAFWSIGPTLALSLFDGGRRKAGVAAARARWTEATGAYRQTVLAAFQQVEDSLSELHHLGDEEEAEGRAVAEASQAARLSLNRYEKGAANYLDVVTAQTAELAARRKALQVATARLRANVSLVRALGGGWPAAATTAAMTVAGAAGNGEKERGKRKG